MIAFWQEYLERELLVQYSNAKVVLLRPSMSFMVVQTGDSASLIEALPSFKNISHVFLPINDCSNPSIAEGGSHWSLLLISVIDGRAFHYDSLSSANVTEAERATQRMSMILGQKLDFVDLEDSPQQANSSDCGVFVCLTMKHLLLNRLLKTNQDKNASMSMGDRTINAASGRKEILRVIGIYRREGELRRSSSPHGSKSLSPPRVD